MNSRAYPGVIPYRSSSPTCGPTPEESQEPHLVAFWPKDRRRTPSKESIDDRTNLHQNFNSYWQRQQQRNYHWTTSKGTNFNENNSPRQGSQSALISVMKYESRQVWPKGKDFLFAVWAFILGTHGLTEFPLLVLKYGGIVFIMIYLIVFLLIGTPMLLLEMSLGQYAALSATKFYRNLCPVLTGVGFAVIVIMLQECMCNLAVIVWSCNAIYILFTEKSVHNPTHSSFFRGSVLKTSKESGLHNLGLLHGDLAIVLGVVSVIVFILIATGTKFIGKISMFIIPVVYGTLMTLVIRGCIAENAIDAILTLLQPDWSHVTHPWVWLDATKLVFLSLQLGASVISTYASYNKYHHNIVRDTGIVAIGHFVWSIMSLVFVFSMLGVASNGQYINLDNLKNSPQPGKDVSAVSITGRDFWMLGITVAETSLINLEYNWLWIGLVFSLVVLLSATNVIGCLEAISACIVDEYKWMRKYKPIIVLLTLMAVFLVNLLFITQGGIFIYYLLGVYSISWPIIIFALLTSLAAIHSHGSKYLIKDIESMAKLKFSFFVSSHLIVLLTSIIPVFLAACLAWSLYLISQEHISQPLANFSMNLPDVWGMPLGWTLSFLPITIILLGMVFQLFWKLPSIAGLSAHLRHSIKPTDQWYKNEHNEMMQIEAFAPKEINSMRSIMEYNKDGTTTIHYDNGSTTGRITEV